MALGAAVVASLVFSCMPGGLSAQGAESASASDAIRTSIEAVAWMSGCWRTASGVEELWTDGRGGQMLGLNRSWRDGRAVRWEFLRIYEGRSGLIYAAAPSHQPPAEFVADAASEDAVAFRYPEHDFPTDVEYRRFAPDSMVVTVSGRGGDAPSQGFELRFGRIPCDGSGN